MSSENKLFYQSEDVQAKGRAKKLIVIENGKLEISREGKKVLSGLDEKQPCNLVFVFGNARSGKSFMMNCLFGASGVFKVINSSQPCTRGVDISPHFVQQSQLAQGIGAPASKDKKNPLVGFVDVEGQGAEDGTYDTLLALPLLLTSKVVLFNHKGAPTVTDMLTKLGVMARAAQYVDVTDDQSKEDSHTSRKKFGHLHVLFRDFAFSGDREDVYNQLMGKEKVVQSLKDKGLESKAAKERNDIRDLLLENFESINVWLFKQPATADQLLEHSELPENLIDPTFSKTVKELLRVITQQMAEPTYFNNAVVTGPRALSLLTQIATSLNEGGLINVPSVFRAMEKETIARIAGELLTEFDAVIKQIVDTLPINDEQLSDQLEDVRQRLFARYDNELQGCSLDAEIKQKREELQVVTTKVIDDVKRENSARALARVKDTVAKEMEGVRQKFELFCDAKMPVEDEKVLDAQLEEYLNEAKKGISDSLSDIPQATSLPEFDGLIIESYRNLQSLLNLKKLENTSLLKDQTINKLRQDAENQQKKLIEQNKVLEKYLTEEKSNTVEMEKKLAQLQKDRELEAQRIREAKEQAERTKKELEKLKQKKMCAIL